MSDFVKLNWLEIGLLTNTFVNYVDHKIPSKLSSSNVLYTFLHAYTSAFDTYQRDKRPIIESSFISVSACLYFCINDCLNLLNGTDTDHPFIKLTRINKEWLRETAGIHEVLMEMQFLLRFNVFRQQIALLLGETFIMTDGLFAEIESIYSQCMSSVIEGSEMPFSQLPVLIKDVPFINGKKPLEGVAGLLVKNKNILPCFRAISFDYMYNTFELFTMYVSHWIRLKPELQARRRQPEKQQKKAEVVESVSKPIPITGKVAYDDLELITIFDKPALTIINPSNKKNKEGTRKKSRQRTGKALTAANSSSGSSSDEFSKVVQDANDFSLNPEPFEETTTNRERKYVFTPQDHQIISHKKTQIVAPFLKLFPLLFVKEKTLPTGMYLNIFHKKPERVDTKSVAHLSLHPINDLYHFKITAFHQFSLRPPPTSKDYTISFKMHISLDSGELSATIQPFVNNVETEVECPQRTIQLFRDMLDIMVAVLNANRGGIQTRRVIKKNKNKNKRTKKRN